MLRMFLIKADSRKTRQIWNRCWEMGKSCWERSRGIASVCKGPAEVGTSWQCNEGSQHSYLIFSNNPQQPGNRHDGNRQLGHLGIRNWLGMCKGMEGKEREGKEGCWPERGTKIGHESQVLCKEGIFGKDIQQDEHQHNVASPDCLVHFQAPPGSVNLGKFLQIFELKWGGY